MRDGLGRGIDDVASDPRDRQRSWPMTVRPVTLTLGPVDVELHTGEQGLLDYLAEFYPMHEGPALSSAWVVDACVGEDTGMAQNLWGVRYRVDAERRHLTLRADRLEDLAITARKCIREVMVEFCEQRRHVMLHASAIVGDCGVVIVAGDKGSGKTTLALGAALLHGYRYLSNDHLIVYPASPTGTGLVLTSLPTLIPVKVGTYFDLEDLLPPPWDSEGLAIERFRALAPAERYRHDRRLLYTYRRLGQDNPILVSLGDRGVGPDVTVVLARYAKEGEAIDHLRPMTSPVEALMPQVRLDWMFDPDLNQRYLPGLHRDRGAYEEDAARLVEALTERAPVVEWVHRGDPEPLLEALRIGRST